MNVKVAFLGEEVRSIPLGREASLPALKIRFIIYSLQIKKKIPSLIQKSGNFKNRKQKSIGQIFSVRLNLLTSVTCMFHL